MVGVEAYSVNRGETFLLDVPAPGWRPGKDIAGTIVTTAADGSGPPVGTRSSRTLRQRAGPNGPPYRPPPSPPPCRLTARPPHCRWRGSPHCGCCGGRAADRRRLLVTGASGGVGHYLVELATAAGAEVTAVSATVERGHRLRELGPG